MYLYPSNHCPSTTYHSTSDLIMSFFQLFCPHSSKQVQLLNGDIKLCVECVKVIYDTCT